MFGAILIFAASASLTPLEVLAGDEFARAGIYGDILERPAGTTGLDFARQLVESEGLIPLPGLEISERPSPGRMGLEAVVARNGRSAHVRYTDASPQERGLVCRLRFANNAAMDIRWRAYGWCANALGFTWPDEPPPPPIRTVVVPRTDG